MACDPYRAANRCRRPVERCAALTSWAYVLSVVVTLACPSRERDLRQELEVSTSAVGCALAELKRQGLVIRSPALFSHRQHLGAFDAVGVPRRLGDCGRLHLDLKPLLR